VLSPKGEREREEGRGGPAPEEGEGALLSERNKKKDELFRTEERNCRSRKKSASFQKKRGPLAIWGEYHLTTSSSGAMLSTQR